MQKQHPDKKQHEQIYEDMLLIEYVQEIISISIFIKHKYMSGDNFRERTG